MLENTVEKGEITSNFSFSYSVFNRLALQTLKNEGLFGKGLTLNVIRHLIYFQAFAFFLGSVVKSPRLSSTLFQSYSILSFLTGAYIALRWAISFIHQDLPNHNFHVENPILP